MYFKDNKNTVKHKPLRYIYLCMYNRIKICTCSSFVTGMEKIHQAKKNQIS